MTEKIKITKKDLIDVFSDWIAEIAPRYEENWQEYFAKEMESSDLEGEEFYVYRFLHACQTSWVSTFFDWYSTSKEGYNYWFAVDTMWREELEKYEVEEEKKEEPITKNADYARTEKCDALPEWKVTSCQGVLDVKDQLNQIQTQLRYIYDLVESRTPKPSDAHLPHHTQRFFYDDPRQGIVHPSSTCSGESK